MATIKSKRLKLAKKKQENNVIIRQAVTLDPVLHKRLKSFSEDKNYVLYSLIDEAVVNLLKGTGY